MNALDRLADVAAECADAVLQTTGELAQKGKQQAQLLKLEHQLGRAQRQLGALVYTLRKTGTENEALIARYIDAIAELEVQNDSKNPVLYRIRLLMHTAHYATCDI